MLRYSCRSGSCGTCKAKLIAGSVAYGVYQEKALSAAERTAGKALCYFPTPGLADNRLYYDSFEFAHATS